MSILLFAFELYFALQLIVSSLAKIDNLSYFEFTLRWHKIIPDSITAIFSRLFPIIEMILGFLILISYGTWAVYVCIVNLLLFSSFLIYKSFLSFTKPNTDCGCGGANKSKRIDSLSLITSTILVLFAIITLWLTTWVKSVVWELKGITVSFFILMVIWLFIRINLKKQAYKHNNRPNVM